MNKEFIVTCGYILAHGNEYKVQYDFKNFINPKVSYHSLYHQYPWFKMEVQSQLEQFLFVLLHGSRQSDIILWSISAK